MLCTWFLLRLIGGLFYGIARPENQILTKTQRVDPGAARKKSWCIIKHCAEMGDGTDQAFPTRKGETTGRL